MRPETASEKNRRMWRNAHQVLRGTYHPILSLIYIIFRDWTKP
jgi:hypothetical protein